MMENKTKIDLKNKSIFITGAAGFIGSNLAKRILTTVEGAKVVGLDNMNHYYDALMGYAGMDYDTFANTRLRDVPYVSMGILTGKIAPEAGKD